MAWQELTFKTRSIFAEAIAQLLEEHQALAVTLQDAGDQPIYEPALGTMPLWDVNCITGLFAADINLQAIINDIVTRYPKTEYQLKTLADQDWERTWMEDFKPMQFGNRLWIKPSFALDETNLPYQVILDPGLAFGTGKHPTTALCLQWLDAHIHGGETLIDYGCGSGILAIAAMKLGAKQVFAIDHDPQALIATQENALRNAIRENFNVTLPENFKPQQANILMANILAKPLIELASYFSELVPNKGAIILSGILKEQAQDIVNAYQAFADVEQIQHLEDWVRIDMVKK